MEAAFANVTYDGVSGPIDIYEGMILLGWYAKGDREVGNVYNLLNFKPELYQNLNQMKTSSTTTHSFASVGRWTVEEGLVLTEKFTYRSNAIPEDHLPDIYVELDNPLKYLLFAIGGLSLLICLFFAGSLVYFRQHRYMRASQLKLMSLILSGGILTSGRVINAGLSITNSSCISGLWLGHMGFLLVFITLSVKTYRLYRMLGTLKRVKFTEPQAIAICATVMMIAGIYMAFMTSFGNIHESDNASISSNRKTRLMKCAMDIPEFQTILFASEALLLMTGFYFAYKTKDAPDNVNEAKFIAAAVTLITVVCSLVFPVIFLISGITPATRQLIASMSIGLVTIAVMLIIFLPKLHVVLTVASDSQDNQWTNNSLDAAGNSRVASVSVKSATSKRYSNPSAAISPEDDDVLPFQ